jgi:3-hydroxyisobutyrate dehydrogenase-like beta-hydroxyacid dehydrogenase
LNRNVNSVERMGLLGCGRMGAPIGGHLLRAGQTLAVFDPAAEAMQPLVDQGARAGGDPADVAASSDLTLVIVVDDAQVRAVVPEVIDVAAEGSIVAICASVRPDTCAEMARLGEEHGVHVVDAALVRGERGAEEGQLVLFCGGDEAVIDELRRAAAPFTEAVLRVGDIGAGQVAKTANNILLWACIRADVEAQRLARALGVEPAKLREAMALGSGANRPLAEWGKHRLRWPHKDLEVALAVAAEAGVELALVEQLPALLRELTVDDLNDLL